MIISAYKEKGFATVLRDEDYLYPQRTESTYSPVRSVSPQSPVRILQPTLTQTPPSKPSARAARSLGRFLLRRVGIRLIPIIGWGILAKDIYDLATD